MQSDIIKVRPMRPIAVPVLFALLLVVSCAGTGLGPAIVKGAGPDEFLKLRAGPGLGFQAILGLPDGTAVTRRACVTELGQLWCKVSLARAPAISGYVSADYLTDHLTEQ